MDKAPAGTPLILLHGFAEDSSLWDIQKEYLKDKHRLIIPDLPGSGQAPLTNDTSMEGMAAAVKARLDAENIAQCIMVGHSMGGYVALAFAELYPERLKAFGLFHSTSYADTEEKKAARKKGIEFIRKNGAAPFIRQSIPNLFSERSKQEHPEWVQDLIQRYSSFAPDALVSYYEAMIRRPDRSHVLNNFNGPVLFVIGGQDSAVPLMASLQQCHMPSISHIHILQDAGHMGMIEDSDRAGRILDNFTKDNLL
ncbi:MAG TPA: alpha/beta fold hydrolase [Puia sp.]|nr:alpha/beta fold hydrolase [Puia sp.]